VNASLPPLPPGIGMLSDAQANALNQRYPKSVSGAADCITCDGAKTFRWYDEDRSNIVTYDCPCADQYRLSRWLWNAGVMPKFQRLGWHDLVRVEFAGAEVYADYVANSRDYIRGGLRAGLPRPPGHRQEPDRPPRGQGTDRGRGRLLRHHLRGHGLGLHRWLGRQGAGPLVRPPCPGVQVLLIDDLGRERRRGRGPWPRTCWRAWSGTGWRARCRPSSPPTSTRPTNGWRSPTAATPSVC
jgi:hypothetical protein